jgi:hypothetical protein
MPSRWIPREKLLCPENSFEPRDAMSQTPDSLVFPAPRPMSALANLSDNNCIVKHAHPSPARTILLSLVRGACG